jgi:hypothetical protein
VVVPIDASTCPKRAEEAAHMRSHASPLHGSDSWKRQFFEIGDRSQMAGEALARFLGGPILENRDISAAGKVFAIGAHQQRSQRILPGLAHRPSELFD